MVITFAQYSLLSLLQQNPDPDQATEDLDFNAIRIYQTLTELVTLNLIVYDQAAGSCHLTDEGIRSVLEYERDNPTLKR